MDEIKELQAVISRLEAEKKALEQRLTTVLAMTQRLAANVEGAIKGTYPPPPWLHYTAWDLPIKSIGPKYRSPCDTTQSGAGKRPKG